MSGIYRIFDHFGLRSTEMEEARDHFVGNGTDIEEVRNFIRQQRPDPVPAAPPD